MMARTNEAFPVSFSLEQGNGKQENEMISCFKMLSLMALTRKRLYCPAFRDVIPGETGITSRETGKRADILFQDVISYGLTPEAVVLPGL
jgi:hypothetical protein